MSGSGNWPLLCFCCCCCCRIVWVWNHYGRGFIALARGYCESLHHHRNRWIFLCSYWKKVNRWQQLEPQLLGGPGPWLRLVSWCPWTWRITSSPAGPHCCSQDPLNTDQALWKLFFYQWFFRFPIVFHKARVASLSSLEKETSLMKLRIKIPRFWFLSHNLFF